MANGGKKKNKKNDDSGKKGIKEKPLTEEQKRAIVIANIERYKTEQAKREIMGQLVNAHIAATTSHEKSDGWKKKEEGSIEGKRAADNKRRDSLGGSVSTSSNSSGTDSDEMLSEASKSLVTSPSTENAGSSIALASSLIDNAYSSIHEQVAQSVYDATYPEAVTVASKHIDTMPSKARKAKAGARNLAATKYPGTSTIEESAKTSSSPTPRKVVTPILNGGKTTPSAELAAFRSISDDLPNEMPGATPMVEFRDDLKKEKSIDRFSAISPIKKTEDMYWRNNGGRFPLQVGEWGGAASSLRSNNNPDAFFHDLVRNSFVHTITDPSGQDGQFGSIYGRPTYADFERAIPEKVWDKPEAYFAPKGDPTAKKLDMTVLNDAVEKGDGTWVKLERNVLKNILDDVPNLLNKQKVEWIRDLLKMIFDAKPKKVYNRMRVLVNMLKQKKEYEKKSDYEVYRHIAQLLLEAGTNYELGYSFVHVLSAQGNNQKRCEDEGHRRCMTLQQMLGPLSEESLQRALSLGVTDWRQRTPVHLAAATGQACQLRALQHFNADCTTPDEKESTPVVFAVSRDNLLMLRQLQWYGVDVMQTCDKTGHCVLDWVDPTKKLPAGPTCIQFIKKRNAILEKTLATWMNEVGQNVRVRKGLSEVHTIDCRQPSDHVIEKVPINNAMVNIPHWIGHINKTVHFKLRSTVTLEDKSSMFLVIIPFTYELADEDAPAENPEMVRETLFVDDDKGRGPRPIPFVNGLPFINIRDPHSSRPPLQKAMTALYGLADHNRGIFWAYKVSSDVLSSETLWTTFSLDLLKLDESLRDRLRLLIQVVSLEPINHY